MIINFDESNLHGTDLKVCVGCGNKMKAYLNQCHLCLTYQDGTEAIFSDPDMEAERIEKHNNKYKVKV